MAEPIAEEEGLPPVPRRIAFLDRMMVGSREKLLRQTESMGLKAKPCCTDDGRPMLSPGVLWEGIFSGYSGYGKANREIALRVANSMAVEIKQTFEPPYNDAYNQARFKLHENFRVSKKCPYLRFFGPDKPVLGEHLPRICWTMMETERIHEDMVNHLNVKFDELWTPTAWNLEAFKKSGLTIPGRVMPLGVDPYVYRPFPKKPFPPCTLISGKRTGEKEAPQGFIFLSVGLPSIRKGFDLLARAFDDAFSGDPDVSLVCAVTHFSANVPNLAGIHRLKSPIYALTGEYTEHQMARIYSSADAYASASRGEGWNLPVCEAAACGLPVICPDTTSHGEVAGADAFMFHAEGFAPLIGAESISPWYKDVPFSVFGRKSHAELVDVLRLVRANGEEVQRRARRLRQRMLLEWTWDNAARDVTHRLLELQD